MDNRTEVVLSDLGRLCTPQEHIAPVREIGKWCATPYETNAYSGTMLVAAMESCVKPVTLDPQLTGWYRIFVGLQNDGEQRMENLNLALSDDHVPMHFTNSALTPIYARHAVQETYWRAADLTGLTIEISSYAVQLGVMGLAWFRFVPMDEAEVAAFQRDQARTDTKRIYATNDMHGMLCLYGLEGPEEWLSVVKDYAESDVEWFSMENISIFDGVPATGDLNTLAFGYPYDRRVQDGIGGKYFNMDMLRRVTEFGKGMGIKMCVSMRMGAWGIEFPDDQGYFDNRFKLDHPELRCIDRNGDPIDALSYVYPEVREYILDRFEAMAKTGCDAVEMIYNRGVPYVLFEQPFVDRFKAEYGEDPRYLPLDDERVTSLRCAYMTEFVRELRARLDAVRPGIGLHARVQYSVYDARHVALDLETWCREQLITAIISYPQRIRETLNGDVWQDETHRKLDLDKYTKHLRDVQESIIYRRQDFNTLPPMADSRGVLRGPKDQQERVDEFMRLEKEYGVTVYLEIMPRTMSTEAYRDRALELYDCGCEHISLWDTYNRVIRKVDWTMLRRLGHKEELRSYDSGEGTWYRLCRTMRIGGRDVSRYLPAWGG